MSQVSDYALNRLTSLLPLPLRQATLSTELRQLHQQFLRSLVERGKALTNEEIAAVAPGHDAFAALWTLASLDLLVLDRSGRPIGAYPLTTERTPHEVHVNGNTLWAMCALDAVSVAPLFDADVDVRSRCPVTGVEIVIRMHGADIVHISPDSDVQLGVWWRDPGAVAARNFCPGVVFLRDKAAAAQWQGGRSEDHDFAPVTDAVDVGTRFFRPMLAERPVGELVAAARA